MGCYDAGMQWLWILWIAIGYGCGSVPCGWLIGRAHGLDIRQHGSGNVGATNVARTVGRHWGLLCFALDAIKGLVPVVVSGLAMDVAGRMQLEATQAWCWLAVAAAAVAGHVFPLWLSLRGGKGVATGFGVLMGFWPLLTLPGLAAVVTWLLLASMFRYVSLASMGAAVAMPIYLWLASRITTVPASQLNPFLIVTSLLALLVIVRHRSNLTRLYAGTEDRLGN